MQLKQVSKTNFQTRGEMGYVPVQELALYVFEKKPITSLKLCQNTSGLNFLFLGSQTVLYLRASCIYIHALTSFSHLLPHYTTENFDLYLIVVYHGHHPSHDRCCSLDHFLAGKQRKICLLRWKKLRFSYMSGTIYSICIVKSGPSLGYG